MATTILTFLVASVVPSEASAIKEYVPACVGCQENAPVLALKSAPSGIFESHKQLTSVATGIRSGKIQGSLGAPTKVNIFKSEFPALNAGGVSCSPA